MFVLQPGFVDSYAAYYSFIEPQHTAYTSPLVCPPRRSLHLVLDWFQYSDETMRNPQVLHKTTKRELVYRNSELVSVLQVNLLHPLISDVHLRMDREEDIATVKAGVNDPCGKIHFSVRPSGIERTFASGLQHVNNVVQRGGRFVLAHSDIIIGGGFDATMFPGERHLLFLSRFGLKHRQCGSEDQCGAYQGSHDSIVGRTPVDGDLLAVADFPRDRLGSENLFIYYAQKVGYNVTNPCTSMRTYHSHCVGVRIGPEYHKRMNTKRSADALPT
jgi:hypothetical protein